MTTVLYVYPPMTPLWSDPLEVNCSGLSETRIAELIREYRDMDYLVQVHN